MTSKIYIFILFCFAFTLSGCLKEDMSDCEDEGDQVNFILTFSYLDEKGEERFADHIGRVEVFIFDEQQKLAVSETIEAESLREFSGARYTLDPGTYHVVCWGNLYGTYSSSVGDGIGGSYLLFGNSLLDNTVFYAPRRNTVGSRSAEEDGYFTVVIPRDETVEKKIEFMESSRTITVTVIGYDDTVDGTNLTPSLELTEIPMGYDFIMNLHQEKGSYRRNTSELSEDRSRAIFQTPYFGLEEDMTLVLTRRSTGAVDYAATLCYIMEMSGIDPGPEESFEIEMEFMDGYVKIRVFTYKDTPVVPDI